MRHPILSLLVAVCACCVHGGPVEAQSRIGRAGGAAAPRGNPHGGGGHSHGPVSPPAQQPRSQPPSWSGGGGRGGWHHHDHRGHHHDHGGRWGRRSGGFGFSLGIGGLGFSGGYGYGGWPGYRGYSSGLYGFDYVPDYHYGGYYYGAEPYYLPGYDEYSFYYGYGVPRYAITPAPQWIPVPPPNDPLADPRLQDPARWNEPLAVEPLPEANRRRDVESSPAAKLRSLRAQGFGDQWFRQQQYQLARDRYKSAVQDAPERAEARFRLAFAYAALGAYELAVREIKTGLQLDPSWPSTGASLDALFGENNRVAKLSLISRASTWAQQDPRDPDRLFLLGVLHYFNEDMEKALPMFKAARQLAGSAPHLEPFAAPAEPQLGAPVDVPPPEAKPIERRTPGERPAEEFLPPLPTEEPSPARAEEPPPIPEPEDNSASEDAPAGPALPPLPQP